MSKDFTKAQAKRWVVEEAAKHGTVKSMMDRIATEKESIAMFKGMGPDKDLPISRTAHSTLITVLEAKSAKQIGAEFVRILREWITDPAYWVGDYAECESAEEAWAKMCADNSDEPPDSGVDHSHDWCDANMAMAEAFENLGLDPLPDDDADRERMMDLWNAAWTAAGPALRGETKGN